MKKLTDQLRRAILSRSAVRKHRMSGSGIATPHNRTLCVRGTGGPSCGTSYSCRLRLCLSPKRLNPLDYTLFEAHHPLAFDVMDELAHRPFPQLASKLVRKLLLLRASVLNGQRSGSKTRNPDGCGSRIDVWPLPQQHGFAQRVGRT